MTPFSQNQDVFQTQADSRFNSFSDPLNAVNTNPGNWGVDPNYMTPSYMSPYRPRYQGPTGNQGNFNPSFWNSVHHVMPFRGGGDNYGGNYTDQNTPYFDSIHSHPIHGVYNVAQSWVLPIAMTYGAFKYLDKPMGRAANYMASKFTSGLLGPGNAAIKSHVVGAVGGAAGLAARWMGPLSAVSTGMDALNSAAFEPFIAQNDIYSDMRRNFKGITYAGGGGDPYTGGGISRRQSWSMAGQLSKAAAKDLTFTQDEMSNIADYSARSGLLDNANPQQMVGRIKDISKQLKVVMAIANTSDFKESIELLSKLQFSGVSGVGVSQTLGRLGGLAGAAGVSVQKMMNTTGMQGQMLFGANGLTPGFGQIAAAQSLASFNSAYQSGLISPQLMARMGGREGATQSSVAGMVGVMQSPYVGMSAYNSFMNGGDAGSVVGNLAKFGGSMAANPLEGLGRFNMLRPSIISQTIKERGLLGVQDSMYEIAKGVGQTKNGKMSDAVFYEMATKTMGLPHEHAMAMLSDMYSGSDEKTFRQRSAGMDRAKIEARAKMYQQAGLDYGGLTPTIQTLFQAGRDIQHAGASAMSYLGIGAGIGDDLQNWWSERKMGPSSNLRGSTLEQAQAGRFKVKGGWEHLTSFEGISFAPGRHALDSYNDLHTINKLADKSNEQALIILSKKASREEKEDALRKLAKSGEISSDYVGDRTKINNFFNEADFRGVDETKGDVIPKIQEGFQGLPGNSDFARVEYAHTLAKAVNLDSMDPEEAQKVKDTLGKHLGRTMSGLDTNEEYNSERARKAAALPAKGYGAVIEKFGGAAALEEELRKVGGDHDALAKKLLKGDAAKEFYAKNNRRMSKEKLLIAALNVDNGGQALPPTIPLDTLGTHMVDASGKHYNNVSNAEQNKAILQHSLTEIEGVEKDRSIGYKLVHGNRLTFENLKQMKGIDSGVSVGIFHNAVVDFKTAVDSMNGGKPAATSAANTDISEKAREALVTSLGGKSKNERSHSSGSMW